MAAFRKLVIGLACVAIATAALILWLHERHAAESKKLSIAANEIRVHADEGDADAEDSLGNLYLTGRGVPKDYAEAALWYRKGAEQGNPKAQFNMAKMYEFGEGVPKDYAEALRWLRKSADQCHTSAESALGYMYFNGEGVARDESQGFAWYRKAAEAGDLPAQQFVGWMYYYGRGVHRDYSQAAAWYQKAADQGDAISQATLGYMYAYGLGVEKDSIGSLRCYRMAAAQGEPTALRYLKSLRPTSTTRYLELVMAIIAFFLGFVFALSSWDFALPGRKLRDWRQPFEALLSAILFACAGLNLYASEHVIRYLPFHKTFQLFKGLLFAAAVLIVVTVVLPAKKNPELSTTREEHS